jgi:hypothetical protein
MRIFFGFADERADQESGRGGNGVVVDDFSEG